MTEPGARLATGDVYWVRPDAVVGREQAGRRPYVIVATAAYLELVDTLVMAVPVTTVDRDWPNHVALAPSADLTGFAMCEQLRAVARDRLDGYVGHIDDATLEAIREWLADYLGF